MALPFLYGCRKRGLHLSDPVLSPRTSLQPTIGTCPPCSRPRGATLALLDPQEVSLSLRSETRTPIVLLTSSGSSIPFMQRAECDPFVLGSLFLRPHEALLYPLRPRDAFEWYRSPSTYCEEWGTKHPLWVPVFQPRGRGALPRRPVDQATQAIPRPRQGVALIA